MTGPSKPQVILMGAIGSIIGIIVASQQHQLIRVYFTMVLGSGTVILLWVALAYYAEYSDLVEWVDEEAVDK